ncbi:hypothetical protein DMP17_44830 [Pseudonocardia sp. TMWB2A]|uniref:hypothetical protein n=1 Tax=Pseudonocardia sp. TMWB2A TaxID=687430 RepID=UPI00307DA4BC
MAETNDELAARAVVEAYEAAQVERIAQRQRAQVDTAKVVVTFVQAVAGALVGTGLQVTPNSWPDIAASAVLGLGLLLALITIARDRLIEPNFSAIDPTYTDVQRVVAMETLMRLVAQTNETVVISVKAWAFRCVATSIVAGGIAVVALLIGGSS